MSFSFFWVILFTSFCSRMLYSHVVSCLVLNLAMGYAIVCLGDVSIDCSANSGPYFNFSFACWHSITITYSSAFSSSGVATSTGLQLKYSVVFKLLPAICCIAISKCAFRSNQRGIFAVYCLFHQYCLQRFYCLLICIQIYFLSVKITFEFF